MHQACHRVDERAVEACATLRAVAPSEHLASDVVIARDHPGLEADDIIRTARVAPAVSTAWRRDSCRAILILPRAASALDELTFTGANARPRSWLQ
jgi:hypothetical protein